MTAIVVACEMGDLETVIRLNHLELTSVPIYHNSLVYIAANHGHISVIQYLIMCGSKYNEYGNESLLVTASANGNYSMLLNLIKSATKSEMNTALKYSSSANHLPVVKYLVNRGANVNSESDVALKLACAYGNSKIVEFLVEHGANVHTNEDYPLRIASSHGNLKIVEFLVNNGADIHNTRKTNYCDKDWKGLAYLHPYQRNAYILRSTKECALVMAFKNGHLPVVQYLLEHGADIKSIKKVHILHASFDGHNNAYNNAIKFMMKHRVYYTIGSSI